MISGYHAPVAEHYEKYPYPYYPWYSIGSWKDLQSVDVTAWGAQRRIEDIWISGCGTIAPAMFGRRNYFARVLATDLSEHSIKIARRRINLLGIRNVFLKQEDLFDARYEEAFDAVDSFGVLHHTVSPQKSLAVLARSLRQGGVLRLMVYSQNSRKEIEALRHEVRSTGLHSIESVQDLLKTKRIERSGDLENLSGVADALLNPIVHTFTEEKLREMIANEPSLSIVSFDSASNFKCFCIKR